MSVTVMRMASSTEPPLLQADCALFLDFDGTVVALAAQPQAVQVQPWVVPTLMALQQRLNGALAIISGREIGQVDAYLQPLRCWAAGAHGLQLRGPAGYEELTPAELPAAVWLCARELVAQNRGLLLEAKPGGFALHYRQRPELAAACQASLQAAMSACDAQALGWALMQGHCVLELKLKAVSKGVALRSLCATPAFAGRRPVFLGDDTTDEHAIEAAQDLGGDGVRVGPGQSIARFRLDNTDAVAQWLMASARHLPLFKQEDSSHA